MPRPSPSREATPRRVSHRRFSIVDGMWLIGAAAVGMVLSRDYLASLARMMGGSRTEQVLEAVYGVSNITALALMLVLIPLRLRRPRPGPRWLARQPGFAACVAATAALGIGGLHSLVLWAFRPWGGGGQPWPFQQLWVIGSMHVPHAVAGCWLILLLSGRWRAEPGWIDRLGRACGFVFVGWLAFGSLVLLIVFW